ncbi:MAG: FtsX-like permease family protein [Candidatus Bathyarchaeia archaeon]
MATQPLSIQGQETATLTGSVLDENGEPVRNSVITVFGPGRLRDQATTDSSGSFQFLVNREGWYSVYVMCDRSETPGVDYVPSLWETYLQVGSAATFTFILERGASVYLDGEIRFVESSKPADYCGFTVTSPDGGPLGGKYSVYTYGSESRIVSEFGFSERLIVIPADTEVAIRVDGRISSLRISHAFSIKGEPGYFKLSQGEDLHIDSIEYILDLNLQETRRTWDSAFCLLKDAEHVGFLVSAERQDLMDAYSLIDASLLSMKKRLFEEAFAKLRNAYILTSRTIERLQGLIQMSSLSALLLMPIFAFIASSSAYLITEREGCIEMLSQERRKFSLSINLLISILFYSVLVCTFYLANPGCRLISQYVFLTAAILALIIGQVALAASQRAFSEKTVDRSIQFSSAVIIAFSMACRNLRRRKLRSILSLANMMILVFGFVTFTSISPGFGLVTQPLPPSIPQYAILVRDKVEGSDLPLLPLPSSFLTWLEHQPNTTLISPKAENIPRIEVLGNLYTRSGKKFFVRGILGIIPSIEANFTHIDEVTVGGDYLQDDDLKGILICSSLRERLGVDVGDKLYGFDKEFTIRGFFDKGAIENLKDVDGSVMIPRYIIPSQPGSPDPPMVTPCSGDDVIMVSYDVSLSLPGVLVSRVNVQLKDGSPREYSELAQIISLNREYRVYVSHPNSLYLQYMGSYVEEKGAGLVPFVVILVMLNVSVMMLGSVSERRDEIASLSSVGLNPTHISALFVAEAAIIGFIGGGLGYLLGMLGYRTALTTWFGALQVREKASAEWGLIALLFSGFTAIIASLIPAVKASTIVTPSLLRKWSISEVSKPKEKDQPWVLDLPVKLMPRELEPFMGFIQKRIGETGKTGYATEISLKEEETERGPLKRLMFRYSEPGASSANELLIQKREGKDFFEAKLLCTPSLMTNDAVRNTTTHVRNIIFEWNAIKFEVVTPFDQSLSQLYTLVNAYNPTSLYIATTQPIPGEKIGALRNRLVEEGIRPPRIVISRVDPSDIERCIKTAEELVSRADVVCISGGPDAVCTALAMSATLHRKMICSVVDPRPMKLRMKDLFRNLKIVNVQPEKG